jgi:hypothetical protein
VFAFELSADEMAAIDGLDTGRRGGPDPDIVDTELFPARARSVKAWSEDFWIRGGFDVVLEEDDYRVEELPKPVAVAAGAPRWPNDKLDRRVAKSAFEAGCHVLLTEDGDVLKCHVTMHERGMAVLRPARLLEHLAPSLKTLRSEGAFLAL